MWRWVTRGLMFLLVSLLSLAALAQQPSTEVGAVELIDPAAGVEQQPTEFVGAVDLPDPAVTQSGVVLVKGWAYDRQGISKIELYVDGVFQYRVQNLNLPRIDLEQVYPNYPGLQNSNPGFMTGFLASRFSNGPHTVELRVYTTDGRMIPFGTRTVQIDNTINQSPFGHLDIPDATGTYNATGSFPVVGWAADADGIATVDVQVDNLTLQSAMYGDGRPDVGNTYPDFAAANFSGFIANIDTTRLQDGIHLLTVRATDRFGMSRMIGQRQIQVFNNNANLKPFGFIDEPKPNAHLLGTLCTQVPVIVSPVTNPTAHITPVRGWALDLGTRSDIGRVAYVELLIDGVQWNTSDNCGNNSVFGGLANCYGIPRYDVARYYPTYPDSPQSGFMFTLDVGALLALGVSPGRHIMKVRVADNHGTFAELPTRDGIPVNFGCAGQNQDFPSIGFIDVPTSMDFVKGTVVFQGWAVDENIGVNRIEMYIDGNFVGHAQHGFIRTDVEVLHPYIFNSRNSGWRFSMDTTKLSNARHRLTVRVVDQLGNANEIGSVDFYTSNPASSN